MFVWWDCSIKYFALRMCRKMKMAAAFTVSLLQLAVGHFVHAAFSSLGGGVGALQQTPGNLPQALHVFLDGVYGLSIALRRLCVYAHAVSYMGL
ncbi:hypothetical protein XENTR_v10021119 [Xenopus tropicalis]|nr:hypothetical protein XENTR_v10021119 [Xenopus tropicalis]